MHVDTFDRCVSVFDDQAGSPGETVNWEGNLEPGTHTLNCATSMPLFLTRLLLLLGSTSLLVRCSIRFSG
jgi:hypothetical protein